MPQAQAQSKRDMAAVAELQKQLDAAEQRYRDALQNEDEEAAGQSLAAMQSTVSACVKQKGCEVSEMLESYERLLKLSMPVATNDDPESDGDPIDEDDLADTDVPDEANANVLLSEEGKRFVQMVQFNPAVQAGIRRWLTDMRPSLMTSYENYRYMQHLMAPSFKKYGLPEALLFGIVAQESNGKVHVGSRAGAVGPLQFMPATGKRFGLGDDGTGFDTRYDPRASAEAAAQYLNERMQQLNSSIELSLAGYNGGEGRALRVYREFNGRSFWDIDVYNQFPSETKDYVPMVVAAAWLFLHPKEYGIRWPRMSTRPAQLQLARATSFYELTICLGNYGTRDGYLRTLRNLNPRWAPSAILSEGTTLNVTTRIAWLYNLHCRTGKRMELASQLMVSDTRQALVRVGEPVPAAQAEAAVAAVSPTAKPAANKAAGTYKVRKGDVLGSISRKYQCNLNTLAKANKLKAPSYSIRPGQTLTLTSCKM